MAFGDTSRVFTNVGALGALNSLRRVNEKLSMHQMRLATGQRVNTAEDDPAGYVLGRSFQARSRGLNQALANVGDAKSVLSRTSWRP
jgi:flagellin